MEMHRIVTGKRLTGSTGNKGRGEDMKEHVDEDEAILKELVPEVCITYHHPHGDMVSPPGLFTVHVWHKIISEHKTRSVAILKAIDKVKGV